MKISDFLPQNLGLKDWFIGEDELLQLPILVCDEHCDYTVQDAIINTISLWNKEGETRCIAIAKPLHESISLYVNEKYFNGNDSNVISVMTLNDAYAGQELEALKETVATCNDVMSGLQCLCVAVQIDKEHWRFLTSKKAQQTKLIGQA